MTAEDCSQEGSSANSKGASSPTPLDACNIEVKRTGRSPDVANVSINLGSLCGSSGNREQGGGDSCSSASENLEVVIPKGKRIQICLEWSESAEGFVRCSSIAALDVKADATAADAAAAESCERAGARLSEHESSSRQPLSPQTSERSSAFVTASCGSSSVQHRGNNSRGKSDVGTDTPSEGEREDEDAHGEAPGKECHASDESFKTGHSEDQSGPNTCRPKDVRATAVEESVERGEAGAGSTGEGKGNDSEVPLQTPSRTQRPPYSDSLLHRMDQMNVGVSSHTQYQHQDPMYRTPPHHSHGSEISPLVPLLLTPNSDPRSPLMVRDAEAARRKFEVTEDVFDGVAGRHVGLVTPPPAPPSSWDEDAEPFNRCDTIEECDNEDTTDPNGRSSQSSGLRETRGTKDVSEKEEPAKAAAPPAAEAQAPQEPPQRDPNKVYFVMNRQPNKQTSYYISSGEDVDPAMVRKPPAAAQPDGNQSSPHQNGEQPRRTQAYPRENADSLDCDYRIDHVGRVIYYDEESDVSSITVGHHECGMYPHASLPQGAHHPGHISIPYGMPPYGYHPNQVYPAYPHYQHPPHPSQYGHHQPVHPHEQNGHQQPVPPHAQNGHQRPVNGPGQCKTMTHGVDLLGQIVDLITPQCCATTTRAVKSLGALQPWQSVRSMKYHQGVRRRSITNGPKRRNQMSSQSSVSSTKVRVEIAEPAKATECLQSMRGSYL